MEMFFVTYYIGDYKPGPKWRRSWRESHRVLGGNWTQFLQIIGRYFRFHWKKNDLERYYVFSYCV